MADTHSASRNESHFYNLHFSIIPYHYLFLLLSAGCISACGKLGGVSTPGMGPGEAGEGADDEHSHEQPYTALTSHFSRASDHVQTENG